MKIVIFGLSISSSWGNGHATLWRGLCKGLAVLGHRVVFFERDTPYYAANRDLSDWPSGRLVLYADWETALPLARAEIADADVVVITSYCQDGIAAFELAAAAGRALNVFYDLDTPVTLSTLAANQSVPYIGPRGLRDFDLVLSFTGGRALALLQSELGARRVAPLHGSVDPAIHYRSEPQPHYACDLSYLGTYSDDRQAALRSLLIVPAEKMPNRRFLLGGAQYPAQFPWQPNIFFVRHLPSDEHPAFFSSSGATLNVTRCAMADLGWCPSGRLFEAAACGTPMISDRWDGIGEFFAPGEEILLAENSDDVMNVFKLDESERLRIGRRAQARALDEHNAAKRAREMIAYFEAASYRTPAMAEA